MITGAYSGMGRVTAQYLAECGYRVYATSRDPERLRAEFEKSELSDPPRVVAMDLHSKSSVAQAVETILQENKGIDVLVNNAGYGLVATVEEAEEEEIIEQFQINLFGLLRVTRQVIPVMRRRQSGVIVNISSFLGRVGLPLLTFYNASKYAVEGVTDSLRLELAPAGIRVHSVMPGFFSTQFARKNLKVNAKIQSETSPYAPLSRQLAPRIVEEINHGNDPMEVAHAIRYLIETEEAPARVAVGEIAKKFLAMRRELNDAEYEQRVRDSYGF
ncbi:SDR family oxidoreductase [Nitratifractor salsuginis]|uniref:SDR family oxidoreductase n=1 Tax=Nitratifractor salsuginis TaxID=269261 RepID=UPI0002FBE424|nr:SDR family oxidoreductase [Nitratifractor salsuginis]